MEKTKDMKTSHIGPRNPGGVKRANQKKKTILYKRATTKKRTKKVERAIVLEKPKI